MTKLRTHAKLFVFAVFGLTLVGGIKHGDSGRLADYETRIFFESNVDEMEGKEIRFDKPLPNWLYGTLIRNGVGRFEIGPRQFTDTLDAFAKLASWTFYSNGSTYFTTKMLYSDSYVASKKTSTVAPYLLLDTVIPPFTPFEEIEAFKNGPDNMNVNVYDMYDVESMKMQYVAVSDFWPLYQFRANDLSTVGRVYPPVPGDTPSGPLISLSTAHMLPEYNSTSYITFGTFASVLPGQKSILKVLRATSAGERELISEVKVDKASYMHSFGLSKNYATIFAVPFHVDPIGMMKHLKAMDAFKWDGSLPTNVFVTNLKTGKMYSLATDPMFFLHVVNSFEINDHVIMVDVAVYANASNFNNLELFVLRNKTLRSNPLLPDLKRFTIDLDTEKLTVDDIQTNPKYPWAANLDFPTINENYRHGNYCYTYGVVYSYDHSDWFHMMLVKKDVCTGQGDKVWYKKDHYFNEAFFVPRPGGVEEDDGVLMLPILDNFNARTNLTVFDARDLTIISTSVLPTNIPFGTHGRFFENVF